MFRSLRNQLIFSYILPSLIVIPLLGIAILYVLENQVLLPIVYKNLVSDARLMAEITRTNPQFWSNSNIAQVLVDGAGEFLSGQVDMLLINGSVLASGRAGSVALANQRVELPNINELQQGDVLELRRGPSAEVYTPVISDSGQLLGVIRMTTHVVTVMDEIYQVRYLMGGVLFAGVLAGVLLGSVLAFNINRPVQQITRSVARLADGNWEQKLEETGFTETRVLARTINELVSRIQSLEQARRQLLANLVHEIGRPLGAFRSGIQALLKGASQDSVLSSELLTGMDGETVRLQHLLDDLAQLHDQVLGPLELQRVRIDIPAWLPGILAPWKAAADQKELAWEISVPPDLPVLHADPDRLAQVISNLLSNAIKFTPQKGKISISVYTQQDRIWFQIQDTGPGISPEEQALIFQPFFRGRQGKRIVQGMGLGLSIAKEIILAHGGEIQVESAAGSGSCFSFWLSSLPGI